MKKLVKESLLEYAEYSNPYKKRTYSPYVPPNNSSYVVVSFSPKEGLWGMEGDFDAKDEKDAVRQAKEQEWAQETDHTGFKAFLVDSKELQEFIDNNPFID